MVLQCLDNDLTSTVDFWVQTTIEGYMVEFAAERYQSYSKADVVFKSGLRVKQLKEVPLWIKMLMVEEGLIPLHGVSMVA